ncbi:hypothetical protein CLV84_3483 [Neolewinella xylanilytica]|uniref:Uncharacterized protein n=1 Tax=Neolewinella xylanilytica TaxID=1514080 RepID=A0A2S6I5X5_9BACT|nr:hypothetical protein [Neolewinella xylanilytica]PPK86550.1 hypothetical protein CLV84_3483 [Neolewinella xylanilytica]
MDWMKKGKRTAAFTQSLGMVAFPGTGKRDGEAERPGLEAAAGSPNLRTLALCLLFFVLAAAILFGWLLWQM